MGAYKGFFIPVSSTVGCDQRTLKATIAKLCLSKEAVAVSLS